MDLVLEYRKEVVSDAVPNPGDQGREGETVPASVPGF